MNSNLRNLTPINSSRFTWSRSSACTEHSDLRGLSIFQQLYKDAADRGFAVYSEKTGNVATFVLSKELVTTANEERETTGWEFTPTDDTLRQFPNLRGMKITIFND